MITPLEVSRPVLVHTREELANALADVRGNRGRVGLVPTMGALHAGHASLIRTARELVENKTARELVENKTARELVENRTARELVESEEPGSRAHAVVVSIFVNPMQFGENEDLARYPRTFAADLEVCAAEGADIVFAPAVDEVYPGGEPQVTVDPGPLAEALEGRSRPTHFHGVLTVVAKLFGLVRPDLAVFGEKDYQQLVLIRRMVDDLCMGIGVVGGAIVREPSGLALSSRNQYLTPAERTVAAHLSLSLTAAAQAAHLGGGAAVAAARSILDQADGIDVDYLELTSPELIESPVRGDARLLVAARVGTTRLIDNTHLVLGPPP